jgi:hypothetical protein
MDRDQYEREQEEIDEVVGGHHPYFRWSFLLGILVIVGVGVWYLQETSSDRMLPAGGASASLPVLRQPVTDSQPSAAAEIAGPRPLGTTGQAEAAAEGGVDSPAVIKEIETITGANDGHELIGRKVNLHVPVQGKANDVAFWVGEKDNRILVVMERDRRDGKQRQDGEIAAHGIAPVHAGQQADITGTIMKVPSEEERYSWLLTNEDKKELAERPIYIRADTVTAFNGQ